LRRFQAPRLEVVFLLQAAAETKGVGGEEAQTSLEYLFLIAGGVLFVLIIALLFQNYVIKPAQNTTIGQVDIYKDAVKNVSK